MDKKGNIFSRILNIYLLLGVAGWGWTICKVFLLPIKTENKNGLLILIEKINCSILNKILNLNQTNASIFNKKF